MRPIRSHLFRGKRYRIRRTRKKDLWGKCESPRKPAKSLYLCSDALDGDKLNDLDTCIHEGLHACVWDLDEVSVEETATSIARFLWRLGWRKSAA